MAQGAAAAGSGPAIIAALDQVAEIQGLGLAGLGAEAVVPPRRLGELAQVRDDRGRLADPPPPG